MKISAISDVHIKKPHDEAYELLLSFLAHPQVRDSQYVLFLGDIFDLMVGPHDQYLQSFDEIFKEISFHVKMGKRVFFFEGNHDVHLEKLFKKVWINNEVRVEQDPVIEIIEGKSYYFSHGDEHEVENLSYQRYIKFIRSGPLKFVADYLIPYVVLNFFGERASRISRKKGSRNFDPENVRQKFRSGMLETTKGQYDFVLGGHSHVQDQFKAPGFKSTYLNNGYALKTKTFILIEDHVPSFVSLG